MTINKTSGHRNDTVTITCSTNINTSNRSATISVKARTLQENIVINQEKMLFGDVTITVTNNLLRTYFIDGSCNLVSSHGIEQEFLFDMSSDYPEYKQTLNLYQDT